RGSYSRMPWRCCTPRRDMGAATLRHRPDADFVPGHEVAVVHVRIAVDEGAIEHRMPHAARLVLDLENLLVGVHIDGIDEAILVLLAFLGDEASFDEPLVWT